MDLSAIVDEFNRRKAQAGQRIGDMFTVPKKPANWFEQMKTVQQNTPTTPQQRENIHSTLADIANRMAEGMVPPMIRERERAMRTDPSAAAKPFSSEEIKQAVPFVTAAAPIAYHGTPHSFEKFDASKIGTGQGAQSYGHGLYFAENPQVAKSYQEELSRKLDLFDSETAKLGLNLNAGARGEVVRQANTPKTPMEAAKYVQYASASTREMPQDKLASLIEAYRQPRGSMYQVNIPDQHAAKMLDWDKPLSEQTLPKELVDEVMYQLQRPASEITGAKFYEVLANRRGNYNQSMGGLSNKSAASEALAKAGIPGIKYLDQGSRAGAVPGTKGFTVQWNKGQTAVEVIDKTTGKMQQFPSFAAADAFVEKQPAKLTSNFVVFDPAILEDVTRR